MSEQIDLTVPIQGPAVLSYKVIDIHMNWPNGIFTIILVDNIGGTKTVRYTGATATTYIQAFMTANLSVKSGPKRILERLIADGELIGTISGAP